MVDTAGLRPVDVPAGGVVVAPGPLPTQQVADRGVLDRLRKPVACVYAGRTRDGALFPDKEEVSGSSPLRPTSSSALVSAVLIMVGCGLGVVVDLESQKIVISAASARLIVS